MSVIPQTPRAENDTIPFAVALVLVLARAEIGYPFDILISVKRG
jgi:hypothetical protein